MKRLSLARSIATVACSLGLVLGSFGAVNASEDDRGKLVDATETLINPVEAADELEALMLPAIPLEVAEYTEALQGAR